MDAGEIGRSELNEITESIIGCAFTVGNTLGSGFVEKVYENALAYELRKNGSVVEQQHLNSPQRHREHGGS
jgi:GxxExxY protein